MPSASALAGLMTRMDAAKYSMGEVTELVRRGFGRTTIADLSEEQVAELAKHMDRVDNTRNQADDDWVAAMREAAAAEQRKHLDEGLNAVFDDEPDPVYLETDADRYRGKPEPPPYNVHDNTIGFEVDDDDGEPEEPFLEPDDWPVPRDPVAGPPSSPAISPASITPQSGARAQLPAATVTHGTPCLPRVTRPRQPGAAPAGSAAPATPSVPPAGPPPGMMPRRSGFLPTTPVALADISLEALARATPDNPAIKIRIDPPPVQLSVPAPADQATTNEAEPPRKIRRPKWLDQLRDEDPPD